MRRGITVVAAAAAVLAGSAAQAQADNVKDGPGEPRLNFGKSSSSAIVFHCRTAFFSDRPGVLVVNEGRGVAGRCELLP